MSETSIGTKVRTRRESLGRSRESIAFAVGVSTSTVTRLERDNRIPATLTMKKIADELTISLDALLSSTPASSDVTSAPSGGAATSVRAAS